MNNSELKNITPLVTVNILSFNRKNELRITLTKVFDQDYKNIEVIVVDNASSDGTQEMVKNEFPVVKLIGLKENIGIAGWNEGFKVAKGEYVLVLDDDAYPTKNVVKLVVQDFLNYPQHGAIALKVLNIYNNNTIKPFPGGWVPINIENKLDWHLILGCAFALRKKIYIDNLFVQKYFINFHEFPIILQIEKSGYKIKYSEQAVVYHMNQKSFKINKEKECFHFRNMINFIYHHFSKPKNITLLLKIVIFFFSSSIRRGWFICYLKAIRAIKKPLVIFTDYRFSYNKTMKIIDTGIINYRFTSKFKRFNEKD